MAGGLEAFLGVLGCWPHAGCVPHRWRVRPAIRVFLRLHALPAKQATAAKPARPHLLGHVYHVRRLQPHMELRAQLRGERVQGGQGPTGAWTGGEGAMRCYYYGLQLWAGRKKRGGPGLPLPRCPLLPNPSPPVQHHAVRPSRLASAGARCALLNAIPSSGVHVTGEHHPLLSTPSPPTIHHFSRLVSTTLCAQADTHAYRRGAPRALASTPISPSLSFCPPP